MTGVERHCCDPVEPFPENRSVVVLPGTDHFFDGRLDELQGAVATWAEGRPWENHGGMQ